MLLRQFSVLFQVAAMLQSIFFVSCWVGGEIALPVQICTRQSKDGST